MRKIYLVLFLLSVCYLNMLAEDNSVCGTAILVPENGGAVPVAYVEGQAQYWYAYKAPEDKDVALSVSAPDDMGGLAFLSVASCDITPPSASYDTPTLSKGATLLVERGVTVYFFFGKPMFSSIMAFESTAFATSVEEVTLGGATCDDALLLQDGANMVVMNATTGSYMVQYATWVKYTSVKKGKLFFTCDKTNAPTSVYRYSDCDATAKTLSEDGYGTGIYIMEVEANETVLLKLNNKGIYRVTLTVQESEQGDDRETALTAELADDNLCKATRVGSHWYKFTTVKDGLLDISACGLAEAFSGTLALYKETVSYSDASAGVCPEGNGFYLRYEVKANETYFFDIKLPTAMQENFNFSVANIDFPQGWTKDNPLIAVKGDNPCSGLSGDYWYRYTIDVPSKLEISNVGTKDFTGSLYLYDKDGNQLKYGAKDFDKGGYSISHSAEEGMYFIRMKITKNSGKFNLRITELPIEQGSECSNPIPVQTGENACSGNAEVWYSYTTTADGFLTLVTKDDLTDFTGSFKLYPSCEGTVVASSVRKEDGTGTVLKCKAKAGTTYLIQWTNAQAVDPFVFVISEKAFAPGEDCSNPLPANPGSNALNMAEAGETYYGFTPEQDGWMNLSICNAAWTAQSGSVKVMTDCVGAVLNVQNTVCEEGGLVYKVKVTAGTSYIICITNTAALPAVTAFTLSTTDYVPGETCEKPIELTDLSGDLPAGMTNGSSWYQFITDKAGNYTVSCTNLPVGGGIIIGGSGGMNSSYISLKVGDCAATEIKSNANSGVRTLTAYADAGVKMLVNIVIHKETADVTWKVDYEEPEVGSVCGNPIEVSLTKEGKDLEGVTGGSITAKKSIWYAITPNAEGRMTVSTCHASAVNVGNTGFESMEFYTTCDLTTGITDVTSSTCSTDYTTAGRKKTIEVNANTTYLLNLQTIYAAAFPIQFSLEEGPVSLDKVASGGLFVAPNPNTGAFGVDLSMFGNNKELKLEVINSQAQIIHAEMVNSSIGNHLVRISDALQGIYFLKVTAGDKAVTTKFIVK